LQDKSQKNTSNEIYGRENKRTFFTFAFEEQKNQRNFENSLAL
jgi:hypothetical protein